MELTLSATRLYDLRSIAKPVGKFEESSRLVVVDVWTCARDYKDLGGSGRGIPSETRVVVTLPPTGLPFSRRAMADMPPSPIRD